MSTCTKSNEINLFSFFVQTENKLQNLLNILLLLTQNQKTKVFKTARLFVKYWITQI